MVYIAHVLPLTCDSKEIREFIFISRYRRNFHGKWPLNGWNDDIIQPARDAVLEYYKVRVHYSINLCIVHSSLYSQRYADSSDVERYLVENDLE